MGDREEAFVKRGGLFSDGVIVLDLFVNTARPNQCVIEVLDMICLDVR